MEELAYTARHYGFPGSYAFHDWTLEQLALELKNGNPVVLALGTNGPDQPGHFVTLTGLAADGSRVRVNDPLIGEVSYSREEFQELWGTQGNSGLVPLKKVLAPEVDPLLPWMGVFSALSMLGLMFTQAGAISKPRFISDTRKWLTNPRRKGIGGGLLQAEGPDTLLVPHYEEKIVYMGLKTVQHEVPIYETRRVKVGIRGIKKKIPQYETRRIQIGYTTINKYIPVYKTEKIKIGTKSVKKGFPVTKYRTIKVLEWKKIIRKIPDYHYIGSKRYLIGYKTETRWKRIPVNKRVPYRTTKTITHQVPVYKDKKVISGYRTVTEKVPKYEQQQVLVGYQTILESEPVFEQQRVQVGTKTITRQVPDYRTVRVPVYDQELSGFDSKNDDNDSINKGLEGNDPDSRWWHKWLEAYCHNILMPFYNFNKHPDEVLKGLDPDKLPNFLSLSAKAAWDFNIFSQEGSILSTNTSPGLMQWFYMTQKFRVEPKAVVTVNPGSLINFYFTSGTGSVKITDNLSYIFGPNEWGYSTKELDKDLGFDYINHKHLINVTLQGIAVKYKKEGVIIEEDKKSKDFKIKQVSTLKCETNTIKTEGLLTVGLIVIIAYLLGGSILVPIIQRFANAISG